MLLSCARPCALFRVSLAVRREPEVEISVEAAWAMSGTSTVYSVWPAFTSSPAFTSTRAMRPA